MSKKWRVATEEKILGHFAAKTPEEAVDKAIRHICENSSCVEDDFFNKYFTAKKAGTQDEPVLCIYEEVA